LPEISADSPLTLTLEGKIKVRIFGKRYRLRAGQGSTGSHGGSYTTKLRGKTEQQGRAARKEKEETGGGKKGPAVSVTLQNH